MARDEVWIAVIKAFIPNINSKQFAATMDGIVWTQQSQSPKLQTTCWL